MNKNNISIPKIIRMNSFVKACPMFFAAITCCFILVLFVDQTNLLDIIWENSSIHIVHPEEIENCDCQITLLLDRIDFLNNKISAKSKINLPINHTSLPQFIITDEDSPSIESINTEVIDVNQFYKFEDIVNYSFTENAGAIYLRNNSLLI
jgi:hypothetical protein